MNSAVLKSKISTSVQVAKLPDHAALLFTWCLSHTDDYGRMPACPHWWSLTVAPGRTTVQKARKAVAEIVATGLLVGYSCNGEDFLYVPNWFKHQGYNDTYSLKAAYPNPTTGKIEPTIKWADFRKVNPTVIERLSYNCSTSVEQWEYRTEDNTPSPSSSSYPSSTPTPTPPSSSTPTIRHESDDPPERVVVVKGFVGELSMEGNYVHGGLLGSCTLDELWWAICTHNELPEKPEIKGPIGNYILGKIRKQRERGGSFVTSKPRPPTPREREEQASAAAELKRIAQEQQREAECIENYWLDLEDFERETLMELARSRLPEFIRRKKGNVAEMTLRGERNAIIRERLEANGTISVRTSEKSACRAP